MKLSIGHRLVAALFVQGVLSSPLPNKDALANAQVKDGNDPGGHPWIAHDEVVAIAQRSDAGSKGELEPHPNPLEPKSGGFDPSPAVDASGALGAGLKTSGGGDGDCSNGGNGQVCARTGISDNLQGIASGIKNTRAFAHTDHRGNTDEDHHDYSDEESEDRDHSSMNSHSDNYDNKDNNKDHSDDHRYKDHPNRHRHKHIYKDAGEGEYSYNRARDNSHDGSVQTSDIKHKRASRSGTRCNGRPHTRKTNKGTKSKGSGHSDESSSGKKSRRWDGNYDWDNVVDDSSSDDDDQVSYTTDYGGYYDSGSDDNDYGYCGYGRGYEDGYDADSETDDYWKRSLEATDGHNDESSSVKSRRWDDGDDFVNPWGQDSDDERESYTTDYGGFAVSDDDDYNSSSDDEYVGYERGDYDGYEGDSDDYSWKRSLEATDKQ